MRTPRFSQSVRLGGKALLVIFAVAFATWVYVLYHSAVDRRLEMSCGNTLKQVGLGVFNYHDTYKQLPRAFLADEEGRPVHSWRTAVAPYLAGIRQFYRWDEPWDSPFNIKLAKGLPIHVDGPTSNSNMKSMGGFDGVANYAWLFQCPAAHNAHDHYTNIFVVVGDETVWPPGASLTLDQIGDGLENTILLVESNTLAAYWSEPKDLRFDSMTFEINSTTGVGISGLHDRGPTVVFADGAACRINPKIPEKYVRALLTANGGENITRAQLHQAGWLR